MTHRFRRGRLALIKLLVEGPFEQGSDAQPMDHQDLAAARANAEAAGARWVAQHRGIIGPDPKPRYRGLHGRLR